MVEPSQEYARIGLLYIANIPPTGSAASSFIEEMPGSKSSSICVIFFKHDDSVQTVLHRSWVVSSGWWVWTSICSTSTVCGANKHPTDVHSENNIQWKRRFFILWMTRTCPWTIVKNYRSTCSWASGNAVRLQAGRLPQWFVRWSIFIQLLPWHLVSWWSSSSAS